MKEKMKTSLVNMRFFFIALVLLWIKTYIMQKVSFDLPLENAMQQIIFAITPLSSILLFFGIGMILTKRKNLAIVIMSAIYTGILYANVVYYRFFNDFITMPVLMQTSNMGDLGSSIHELIKVSDLLFFVDIAVFVIMLLSKKFNNVFSAKKETTAILTSVIAIFLLNLALAETERPELLTRTFDREYLVQYLGTHNYLLYDIVLQSKTKSQKVFADSSSVDDIKKYTASNKVPANKDTFGIAKGMNVIVISLESTQSFVLNNKVDGKEITPFLNKFIKESYYFPNNYHQTGQGKTSDAEFIIDNSLYPLPRGAVYFTNATNTYNATPKILKQYGYYNAVFHANNESFWNRNVMYKTLGYDKFFAQQFYDVTKENSVGWGLKDKDFLQQSVPMLEKLQQPFYTRFLTLTNHFPFTLEHKDESIPEWTSDDGTVNRYFTTVRYEDEAIEQFINDLKKSGLYDKTVIVMYGDHYGLSENHNKAMAEYLGKDEITPFDSAQLQRTPLIIHVPGQKGKVIEKVSGQIDVKPTILHLLGISDENDISFGNDLFSDQRDSFAVFRDGSYVTEDYVFTQNICYEKKTGKEVDKSYCEPFAQKAKEQLENSDKIIYGDLFRFLNKNNK